MDQTTYDRVASELLSRARQIELDKRPSYTIGSVDVLRNFKSVAERSHTTARQVWLTYFLKHVDAITAWAADPTIQQAEPIRDRFADAINYLKLGFALWVEEESEKKSQTVLDTRQPQTEYTHYFQVVAESKERKDLPATSIRTRCKTLAQALLFCPPPSTGCADYYIVQVRCGDHVSEETYTKLFYWNMEWLTYGTPTTGYQAA